LGISFGGLHSDILFWQRLVVLVYFTRPFVFDFNYCFSLVDKGTKYERSIS